MRAKRFLIVVLFMTGLGGCCDDLAYWIIEDMNVVIVDESDNMQVDSSLTVSSHEDFSLVIENDVALVASLMSEMGSLFLPSCYAFQCEQGSAGMKDPITSLHVYSNNDFRDVPAGESLNEFILISGSQSISEFLEYAPRMWVDSGDLIYLSFSADPSASRHVFTIRMEMESGLAFEDQVFPITWN